MLIQILFAVAGPTGAKPALVPRLIALDQITDVGPDPATGRAVVSRACVSAGIKSQWPTWETMEAVQNRIALAPVGAAAVLASQADKDAAQAAYDAA